MSWETTTPQDPSWANDTCPEATSIAGYFQAPDVVVDAENYGRLIDPLEKAAESSVSVTAKLALGVVARCLAVAGIGELGTDYDHRFAPILRGWLKAAGSRNPELAIAFADLAITGRRAYKQYQRHRPNRDSITEAAQDILAGVDGVTRRVLDESVQKIVARVDQLHSYFSSILLHPEVRQGLGWIAVSAEQDSPRRPVNVPTIAYPQYDIAVQVANLPTKAAHPLHVTARFAVITGDCVASDTPSIPAPVKRVLLFLHGDGSRLEEVAPLIEPLLKAGEEAHEPYAIIAVDLPSHGYSTMVDPIGDFVGSPNWTCTLLPRGRPRYYTIVEFLERFVCQFVDTLDAILPIKGKLVAPMGGSLGGNLSLRLSRLTSDQNRQKPLFPRAIAWSPASVWPSFCKGDFFHRLLVETAPDHCAVAGRMDEKPTVRRQFFMDSFVNSELFGYIKPQSSYWYRANWDDSVPGALEAMNKKGQWDRFDVYCQYFRQWHYRMDWEQLMYSYQDHDRRQRTPRIKTVRSDLLLIAGAKDNNTPESHICDGVIELAALLQSSHVKGSVLIVKDTGHSIHDERPNYLASQIHAFCTEAFVPAQISKTEPLGQAANDSKRIPTVDLHSHPFMNEGIGDAIFHGRFDQPLQATNWETLLHSQINEESLERSGNQIYVVSMYAHPVFKFPARQSIHKQISLVEAFAKDHPTWVIARNAGQAREAIGQGKKVLILAIERASDVVDTPEHIAEFVVDRGVRIVTFLHLLDDDLGGAAHMRGVDGLLNPWGSLLSYFHRTQDGTPINPKGLTKKGIALLQLLIDAGVWIDFTHSSDQSIRDALPIIKAARHPLLFTHTAIRSHSERGISLEQLEWVKETRGIIGLIPVESLLDPTQIDPKYCPPDCSAWNGSVPAFATQYSQFVGQLGVGSVCLGSDFSGLIQHLKPTSGPNMGSLAGTKGLWNIGQTGELWEAVASLGAPVPRDNAMVEGFLNAWERVKPV